MPIKKTDRPSIELHIFVYICPPCKPHNMKSFISCENCLAINTTIAQECHYCGEPVNQSPRPRAYPHTIGEEMTFWRNQISTYKKVHHLKVHPEAFGAILDLDKNFEYRKNDRDFKEADTVILREYNPADNDYTGRKIRAQIGYVLHGPLFGVPVGYCCFSLLNLQR